MIELSDFVSQSLVQIARGIEKANEQLADSNALASPDKLGSDGFGKPVLSDIGGPSIERIEFDVAVVASESENTKSSGGIKVAIVGAEMTGTSEATNRRESRIKFSVPLLLPYFELKQSPPTKITRWSGPVGR